MDFTNDPTWQQAHRLTLVIYQLTMMFPPEEQARLAARMRDVAIDLAAQIAAGEGGAQGAAARLAYYLLLARDLGFMTSNMYSECHTLVTRVQQMLDTP
ncbi:MAG: hypothetical protein GYB64_11360 [Chloroflexi bacterium]|nr:hypothetical protein [Chloroflexota bacterium]